MKKTESVQYVMLASLMHCMDDPEAEHIGQVGDMKLEDELGIGGQNHGKQR